MSPKMLFGALAFFLTIGLAWGAMEDDDEDLIKELEQLLKSSSQNSKNVTEEEKVIATENDKLIDQVGPGYEDEDEEEIGKSEGSEDACLCKKYFECNVGGNGESNPLSPSWNGENPNPELDIRLGDTVGSQCGHYFDICCDSIRDNVTSIRDPDYKHSTCGKRNVNGVGFRITGAINQEAQFGEFPWMTAIVAPEREEGKKPLNVFLCGGSLIHPRVVLTAAHCVYKRQAQELTVRLGEWDTQTPDEVYRHRDHAVSKVIIHDEFFVAGLYNDVALLILREETKLGPHIDTVCLPPSNVNFDGQRCFASGWGRDSFGKEGRYQVILKKLELPVVTRNSCEYSLKSTRLGRYFRLHESFICAGGEKGKDTCRGDGGSPLVCKVPGSESYIQYGIVAWGIGCGEEGIPGVYVNIPMFVPWITKRMGEIQLDTKFFKIARTGKGRIHSNEAFL